METLEQRQQYLEVYRQQLRREMDTMGYGQSREYTPNIEPNIERQDRTTSTSYGVVAAFTFALLGSG
jgi:hypothetical protein